MDSAIPHSINFEKKFSLISEMWTPKIIAQMNEDHFKLVKIEGEFVWHSHSETDEVFIVLDGRMTIAFRNGRVELKPGEMCVVPRGVEHKPIAESECKLLLVEPAGTVNTGSVEAGAGAERTAPTDQWI